MPPKLARPRAKPANSSATRVDPEAIRKELATGAYDALTLIHNETSCGCMSDLAAIMKVAREFPDVIAIVDTVSSLSAMPIKKASVNCCGIRIRP